MRMQLEINAKPNERLRNDLWSVSIRILSHNLKELQDGFDDKHVLSNFEYANEVLDVYLIELDMLEPLQHIMIY